MKRILFLISVLIFSSTNSFAINLDLIDYISGNDVSISNMQTNNTRLENFANGGVSGGTNITAGSLVSADFSNAVSPVTRWDESFTDFVVSGMLAPTSASLSSTTTAGTAYTDGYRVVIGSTAHTYTASKDTYVFVHSGGYYVYQEVSNGATQPSTPANTQVLFKAISSGTAITTVTDLRQLGITLTSSANIVPLNYRDGMTISRDSTTTITVQPGNLEVNSTRVAKTSATTLTLGTGSDWAGGASLQATSTYGYVGSDISGNLKLHTTAPTHADYGVSQTVGKKRYVTWSGTVYRVLGWFYMNATGSGQLNTYEVGNIREGGVPNTNLLNSYGQVSTASTTYADETSAVAHVYTSGNPLYVNYNIGSGNSTAGAVSMFTISVDGVGIIGTDRGAVGQTSTATALAIGVNCTYLNDYLTQGTHTVQGRFLTSSGTAYSNQRTVEVTER